jgi:hypothetical protein
VVYLQPTQHPNPNQDHYRGKVQGQHHLCSALQTTDIVFRQFRLWLEINNMHKNKSVYMCWAAFVHSVKMTTTFLEALTHGINLKVIAFTIKF